MSGTDSDTETDDSFFSDVSASTEGRDSAAAGAGRGPPPLPAFASSWPLPSPVSPPVPGHWLQHANGQTNSDPLPARPGSDGAGRRDVGVAGYPLLTADVRGYRFSYVDASPPVGPLRATLLCLATSVEGPHGLRRLVPRLVARGYRLLIPSIRGFNPGDPQPKQADTAARRTFYSCREIALDLAGLLASLLIPRAAVVAYHEAHRFASALYLLYPHVVSHAVFLSTPYIPPAEIYVPPALFAAKADPLIAHRLYLGTDRAVEELDADLAASLHVALRPGGREEAEKTAAMMSSFSPRMDGAVAREAIRKRAADRSPLVPPEDEELLVSHYRSIGGFGGPIQLYRLEASTVDEFRGVPRGITVPVLFVGAEFQPASAEGRRADMRRLCPDLEETTLAGAGIWVALERPDEVAAILDDWMRRKIAPLSPTSPARGPH
ncbi:Alpha/Beta hydrolase protein [Hyaloraphidium curvatum]|nr:Alpha/Beta hydrolase protein [Hyaloraphidium curvatum]